MRGNSSCEISNFEKDNIFYKSLITENVSKGGKPVNINISASDQLIVLPSLPMVKIQFNIINDNEIQSHDSLFNIFSNHLDSMCLEFLGYTVKIQKCTTGCFELVLECSIFNSSLHQNLSSLFPNRILDFENIIIDFIIDETKNLKKALSWNELFNYFDEEKFLSITNFQASVLEPINQIVQLCFYKLQYLYPYVFDPYSRKIFAANYYSVKEIASLFNDNLRYETKLLKKIFKNSIKSGKAFPQFEIFTKKK